MRWLIAVVVIAACSAGAPRDVENHVAAPPVSPPLGACPRLTLFAGSPWQHAVFPQCAPEPFATDLPVCGGGACPRPCRVVDTFPDIPPRTKEIRYDADGQWIATVPVNAGSDEMREEATYEGGRLVAVRESNAHGESTHRMAYDHGRLAQTTDLFDDELRLGYSRDGVVRFEARTHATRVDYDTHGRIIAVVEDDDASQATTYSYDAAGYLVELVDGDKETSKYTYDDQHRLVHVSSELHGGDADGAEEQLLYDNRGRIAKIINDGHVDRVYRYTTSYEYCDR